MFCAILFLPWANALSCRERSPFVFDFIYKKTAVCFSLFDQIIIMGTHTKLNYIHIFRAVAIIIIVLGHCVYASPSALNSFVDTFIRGGTTLFVFISGFLFQYLSDTFSYPTYLKKKFFNIILPYLFASIFGIALVLSNFKFNPFISANKIVQVGMLLTTGRIHNLPTWYIPMTCIFFLFAPILLNLEKKIIFRKYSLLFFGLPVLLCISCFVPRFELHFFVTKTMSAWQAYAGHLEKILFDTILFFPIYILGMLFAAYRDKYIEYIYKKRVWIWTIFIAGCIVHFFLQYYRFLPSRVLFNNFMLMLLILGYLWHYDETIKSHTHINNVLGTVADYSFSIFFFHFYFIFVFDRIMEYFFHLNKYYLSSANFHFDYWILFVIIRFSVAFFGSLFAAMLIKKLLEKFGIKHTRWFVGT